LLEYPDDVREGQIESAEAGRHLKPKETSIAEIDDDVSRDQAPVIELGGVNALGGILSKPSDHFVGADSARRGLV
ncbi:MAG: hypothetical protein M3S32_04295, partial [Acidobacteriota bacterium]|nr:hypothetical protein [Acidobacteriota bacterium]